MVSKADKILNGVLKDLSISRTDSKKCYENLTYINQKLDAINSTEKLNVKTTGTINERLVQFALDGYSCNSWYPLTYKKFQWLGDFGIFGYPVNAIVSVKSFTAKERLLASGTGSLLAPTIGWGRFTDEKEFSPERMVAYGYRSFLCIYMPNSTIIKISNETKKLLNFNNKPLIRDIKDFGTDLKNAKITRSSSHNNMLDFSTF